MYKTIFDHVVGHFENTFSVYDSAVNNGKLSGCDDFMIEMPDGSYEQWSRDYCGDWGKD